MFKRIITLLISLVAVTVVFTGCNKLAVIPEETSPPELKIEEDLICGFYLTFEKNGEILTDICSDNFESDDAIKYYFDKKNIEETNSEYLETVYGKDVLFDCNSTTAVSDKDGIHLEKFDIGATLYFNIYLVNVVMFVNPLYMDAKLNKVYFKEGSVPSGQQLSYSVSRATTEYREEASASRTVNGVKEELKYETGIKISYEYSDYLTGVKIIEYDKNNNCIFSSDIDKNSTENYVAGTECEYLVLEETYKDRNDKQYVTRTLFSRPKSEGTVQTAILKFPLDNGLIEPKSLKIKFNY